jgi:hypothetical protein
LNEENYSGVLPRLVTEYNLVEGKYVASFRRDVELAEYIGSDFNNQITGSILVVAPTNFEYNLQTAKDNTYMKNEVVILKDILKESYEFYSKLKSEGVDVHVFYHEKYHGTPDALFPNNWFSTHRKNGKPYIVLYPMKAENRRKERREDIINYLKQYYPTVIDLTNFEKEEGSYLESTGSLMLDRINRVAYVALSERSKLEVARHWAKKLNYSLVTFHANTRQGPPVYHTNVVMAIGEKWVVVCYDVIKNEKERDSLEKTLKNSGREIIQISLEQQENFCGNILELKGKSSNIIALSETAYNHFTKEQITTLEKYAKLVSININTIEAIGGGSIRCMIAELY